jgi:hypothetical protein
MKVTAVAGLMLLACSLSACGIADHYQAQGRMQKSEDAYRQCLVQHTADPTSCNELKKFYEEDKAAYEKT